MRYKAIYAVYPLLRDFDNLGEAVLKTVPGSEAEALCLQSLNDAFEKAVQDKPVEVIYGAGEVRFVAATNDRQALMLACCDWAIKGAKIQTERLRDQSLKGYENLFGPSFVFGKTAQACWALKDMPAVPDAARSMKEVADDAVDTWGRFLCAWQKYDRSSFKPCEERNFWINMNMPNAMEFSSRLKQHLSTKARLFGNDEGAASPLRRRLKSLLYRESNKL